MATNPNTTLLQAKDEFGSDKTPAPLSGASSQVSFTFNNVPPPSTLYIQRDDQLVISCATFVPSEVVTVNARLLRPDGRIEDNQFSMRPVNNRVVISQSFPLAEGYLLSVSCLAAVAVTRGQTFVRVFINRGAFGIGAPGQMLFADYVTTQIGPGYPGGRIITAIEGPGTLLDITIPTPGAGANFSQAVLSNTRWRIQSMSFQFTSSAAAANRSVEIQHISNGVIVFQSCAQLVQAASLAVRYNAASLPSTVVSDAAQQYIAIPNPFFAQSVFSGADVIQSAVGNIQAGDQLASIQMLVEQWLDNV